MYLTVVYCPRREWISLIEVQASPPGGALSLVSHLVSYTGVANVHRIKQDFIFSFGAAERRSLTSDGYTSHAQRYRFFT